MKALRFGAIRLRHLERCMATYPAEPGLGRCFHWSAALCLDLKQSDIVIGTVAGASPHEALTVHHASLGRFVHAWVEVGDDVLAPTLISTDDKLTPVPRAFYYASNGIEDVQRLSRADLLKAFQGRNLIGHLTEGQNFRCDGRFVDILLEAAGVIEWTTNETGGAVPKVVL